MRMEKLSRRFSVAPERSGYQRGLTIGGLALIVLAILGGLWGWPELKRYLQIRRM